jgi:hypothetical protein
VLALAVLSSRSLNLREAGTLFTLFWAQFVIGAIVPASAHGVERVIVSVAYLVLGVGLMIKERKQLARLLREGLFMPYSELVQAPADRPG